MKKLTGRMKQAAEAGAKAMSLADDVRDEVEEAKLDRMDGSHPGGKLERHALTQLDEAREAWVKNAGELVKDLLYGMAVISEGNRLPPLSRDRISRLETAQTAMGIWGETASRAKAERPDPPSVCRDAEVVDEVGFTITRVSATVQ